MINPATSGQAVTPWPGTLKSCRKSMLSKPVTRSGINAPNTPFSPAPPKLNASQRVALPRLPPIQHTLAGP